MTAKCFNVHYSEGQWGTQIEAKLKANDIQDVIDWITKTYTAYTYHAIDIQDDDHAYMMIDTCQNCETYNARKETWLESKHDICENCETTAHFDISITDDDTDSLNLIFATCHSEPISLMKHNAYHDITP